MKITRNDLEGLYAAPKHPLKILNSSPWKIEEMEIFSYAGKYLISVRGEGSCWMETSNLFCGTLDECRKHILSNGK